MSPAVTLVLLAAATTAAHAGSPADKKLASAKTALLGDHLTASLPDGMTLAPRRASVMAADNAADDETRGMLDDGAARFVVMAYELYALAGSNAKGAIEDDFKRAKHEATLGPLALAKPLVAYDFTPTKFTKDKEANLVYGVYVVSGDGSVQVLAFYVNPAGAAQAADWHALSKRVVATLAPGKRVLGGTAGERAVGDLVVSVPAGFIATAQPGRDFSVTQLRKLAVLGQDRPSCGIYIGGHPQAQYKPNPLKTQIKPVAGNVLGTKVDWSVWNTSTRWSTETITAHPNGKDRVHAFCFAPTEKELPDLRKIVETLRKK